MGVSEDCPGGQERRSWDRFGQLGRCGSWHNDNVEAVAWSPDGKRLASAGIDNSVRIWDPETGEETFVFRGDAGMFHDVSWHPDGAQLAAASHDGKIWIWDATRGFERDTTAAALVSIDRKIASGVARGEDLHWLAESYVREGKLEEALAAVKDDPYGMSRLARALADRGNTTMADVARAKARERFETMLEQEPRNSAAAMGLADLLISGDTVPSPKNRAK